MGEGQHFSWGGNGHPKAQATPKLAPVVVIYINGDEETDQNCNAV